VTVITEVETQEIEGQKTEAGAKSARQTLSELIGQEDTLGCIRCGLCSYTCPTYRVERCESAAPRGRIALLRAVAEDKLAPSELFAHKFYDCVLCAACTAACPGGMEVDRLLLEARRGLYAAGLVPEKLAALSRQIEASHNISGEDNARRLVWSENMEQRPAGAEQAQADVVYFVGCVGSFFPTSYSIPQSFVKALEAGGVRYALLAGEEWCCGYPALLSGNVDLARRLAEHNVEAIRQSGARRVVATCPSCYHVFTHVYPELLGDVTRDIGIVHSTELLDEMIKEGRLPLKPLDMVVTYHDPCDLGRKSKLYEPPRAVIKAIPGVKLVEMASHHADALCCGGGGNVETNDPALVEKMSARRLAQAQDTGAQTIVTACQQCKRTLTGAARREKARLRTVDVVELVCKSLES
jgi:heterodisulfide reductase subunit D